MPVEIKYEIVEKIAVLSESSKGWTKEKSRDISRGMMDIFAEARRENEQTAKQTEQMNSKKDGILDSVSSLSSISEENAASTEETSASIDQLSSNMENVVKQADELNNIAQKLKDSVKFFKI